MSLSQAKYNALEATPMASSTRQANLERSFLFFFFFFKGKIEKKFCFQCLVCITDWLAQGGESFLQQLKKAGPWAEQ